jgi:hypothetical protein
MKRCNKCGELKSLDSFYRDKGMKDGHRGDCKVCNLAYQHRRYVADPEPAKARVKRWQQANAAELNAYRRARRQDPAVKGRDRAGHLRRKYGISPSEYDEMLVSQEGVCLLCGAPPRPPYSLHVDHDHATGKIRGLLCFTCNNALGDFADDPDRLRAAARYVEADLARDPAIERRLAGLGAMRPGWEVA